jgi:lipopolysaccharide/colanic/teichoic acid biosynthesis glycosyltransferase
MEAESTLIAASADSYVPRYTPTVITRLRGGTVRAPAVVYVPRSRVEWANRLANIALAIAALIILSPVMLLVALLVRVTSPGPVLYTQQRVGVNRRRRPTQALYDRRAADAGGIVFTIYKFRTMTHDCEKSSGAVWATHNDPRVTAIGRFLRQYRLDELPQLFNVILGDMNIVGPRPERPTIFADLRNRIADYSVRQRARPGITGLAQVSNAYDANLDDVLRKVRYDLEYLERQSFLGDVRIMLRTVPVMLFRRGGW